MGEYADDAIDRDFEYYLDERLGFDYGEREWDDDPISGQIIKKRKSTNFEYSRIIKETNRAWLLEMNAGARQWFPKSECELDEDKKLITVPIWLEQKIIEESTSAFPSPAALSTTESTRAEGDNEKKDESKE